MSLAGYGPYGEVCWFSSQSKPRPLDICSRVRPEQLFVVTWPQTQAVWSSRESRSRPLGIRVLNLTHCLAMRFWLKQLLPQRPHEYTHPPHCPWHQQPEGTLPTNPPTSPKDHRGTTHVAYSAPLLSNGVQCPALSRRWVQLLPKSLVAAVAHETPGVAAASELSNGRGSRLAGRTFLPLVFRSMQLGRGMIPAAFSPSKGGGRIACLAMNQLGGRHVLGECRDPLRRSSVEVHRYGLACKNNTCGGNLETIPLLGGDGRGRSGFDNRSWQLGRVALKASPTLFRNSA